MLNESHARAWARFRHGALVASLAGVVVLLAVPLVADPSQASNPEIVATAPTYAASLPYEEAEPHKVRPAAASLNQESLPPPAAFWRGLEPGDQLAAVVYPTGKNARTLAVVRGSGEVSVCARGSDNLEIGDVANGSLLYTDSHLFLVPATCDVEPRKLVDASDVVEDPKEYWRGIRCPTFAPDGIRVSFSTDGSMGYERTWLTDVRGARSSIVAKVGSCGWVDENHVIATAYAAQDPFAVDVESGARRVFRNPAMWSGWVSHDRSSAMYGVGGYGDDRRLWHTWTAAEGERRLGLRMRRNVSGCVVGAGSYKGDTWRGEHTSTRTSPWEPGNQRILLRVGKRLRVASLAGEIVETLPSALCDGGDVTWFGRRDLIARRPDATILIYHLATRRTTLVSLPGVRGGPWYSFGDGPLMTSRPLGPPRAGASPYLDPSRFVPWDEKAAGFTMALPPSWRIEPCRSSCTIGPYRVVRSIRGREDFRGCNDIPEVVRVGSTSDSVREARRRLFRAFNVHDTCEDDEGCASVHRSTTRIIDGARFRFFEVHFWEGSGVYAIGRAGSRTAIMEMPAALHRFDPSVQLALDSLRFV